MDGWFIVGYYVSTKSTKCGVLLLLKLMGQAAVP